MRSVQDISVLPVADDNALATLISSVLREAELWLQTSDLLRQFRYERAFEEGGDKDNPGIAKTYEKEKK